MRNFTRKLTYLAAVSTLGVFGFMSNVSAQQNAKLGASGQGALPAVTASGDTRKRTFSFSAHQNNDGTVSGTANLHNPSYTVNNGQKYQLQIDIQCMKVIGNVAFFGGLTRRTNDPNLVDSVYFSVQDNGEPGKGTDMISRAYFFDDDPTTTGDPQTCQSYDVGGLPMETIESGNVNVRNRQ